MRALLVGIGVGIGATAGYLLARQVAPTVAHLIFIPSVALLGLVVGWVLGGRAAKDALAAAERAKEAKAARRAARENRNPPS